MIKHYQHTQIGYLRIIVLIIVLFFFVFMGYPIILLILGVYLALISTLTVMIEKDFLEVRFGPVGVIRIKFLLKDIESCQAVKNPWYFGWGTRLTPSNWYYVSGSDAVEIKMKTGKKYRIGTNVPNDLEKAIRQSIERTAR